MLMQRGHGLNGRVVLVMADGDEKKEVKLRLVGKEE